MLRSARVLGKEAQQSNISLPTLDINMAPILEGVEIAERVKFLVQWWEGWYEGLNEQVYVNDYSLNNLQLKN